jgi:hypothetical protein
VLLLLTATAIGLAVATAVRQPIGAAARVGLGIAVGQMLLLWLPFSLAIAFDLGATVAGLLASLLLVLASVPVIWALRRDRAPLTRWRAELVAGVSDPRNRAALLTGLALLLLLAWLHHTHYLLPRADGLHSAGVTWGDLPIHVALATRFLYADGLATLEHPLYLGGSLSYTFLPDYAAGVLAALGLSLRGAFIVGGLVPLAAFVLLLHGLVKLWLPALEPSPTALALLLFFLAGGLGGAWVVARLLEGADWLELLSSTNATYIDPHALKSGHVGNLFVAARTSAFGMSLGLAAILLLGHAVEHGPGRTELVLSGLLVGSLPLVHGHSFLVCCGVIVWYLVLSRERARWAFCLVPLVLAALPQLLWLSQGAARGYVRLVSGFLRPAPSLAEWLLDVVVGVGLWLVVVPLAWVKAPRSARRLALPLLLLLPVANAITVTPSFYDNVKLLAWFDVAGAVLAAGLLAHLLRPAPGRPGLGRRAIGVIALVGCTFSGALAVAHELVNDGFVMSHDEVRFATWVTEHTSPKDVVATAASYHDPVALLSGRRVVLSTPRMLITHGIDARSRVLDVLRLYAGGPAAREVIDRLGVSAVVVGRRERTELPAVDEAYLAAQAEQVLELDGQRLYLLRGRRPR